MTDRFSTELENFEGEMADARRTQSLIMNKFLFGFFIIFALIVSLIALPPSTWLVPTKRTDKKIDVSKNPIQVDIQENILAAELWYPSDYNNLVKIKSLKSKDIFYVMPLAKYSISGRLLDKNKFFPWNFSSFDAISLIDIGLVWGDMADDEYFYKLNGHSQQTNNARQILIYFKEQYREKYSDKFPYLRTHASHTHVIPANKKIMSALNAVKFGQEVKMEGYLVDIYDKDKKRFAMTSLSREDTATTSRGTGKGGGDCEIMYVSRVQIGKKVFE